MSRWAATRRSGWTAATAWRSARRSTRPRDPLRARAEILQRTELRRGAWSVAVESAIAISCTRDAFRVRARLAASEAEESVFERNWDEEVPREGL